MLNRHKIKIKIQESRQFPSLEEVCFEMRNVHQISPNRESVDYTYLFLFLKWY